MHFCLVVHCVRLAWRKQGSALTTWPMSDKGIYRQQTLKWDSLGQGIMRRSTMVATMDVPLRRREPQCGQTRWAT